MARTPKPWYWKSRKSWYVTINGERHNLGSDKKEAKDEFHRLMTSPTAKLKNDSAAAVLDDFLTWCEENRARKTFTRYRDFIQAFIDKHGLVRVRELHSGHVTTWLNERSTWNSTTKRNAITALQRAFNWAVKNRGLDRNPLKGMEKPEAKRRTTVITPAQFDKLLAKIKDRPFRELLIVSYDSGARPNEIKRLRAEQVEIDKQRAVIAADEAKGGLPRAVYFPTARSVTIIKQLVIERPDGALFLNNRGRPWTDMAVKCRMERLEDVLGFRVRHYDLRHSWITRKLIAGVDSHVVAALSGHRDSSMIDRVYSHVADDHSFMLEAAKKGA